MKTQTQPILGDAELVEKLRYPRREWNDERPSWRRDTAPDQWTLTLNQLDFGSVSCEYRTDHWEGHYTSFLKSRLIEFPKSVEEGKQWLEAFLREWSRSFVRTVTCVRCGHGIVRGGFRDGSALCDQCYED